MSEINVTELNNLLKPLVETLPFARLIPKYDALDKMSLMPIVKCINKQIVTVNAIDETIRNVCMHRVWKIVDFSQDTNNLVTTYSEFEGIDVSSTVEEIVSILLNLPSKYSFLFKLPKSDVVINKFEFSRRTKLFSVDTDLIQKLYPNSEREGLLSSVRTYYEAPRFKEGDVLLEIERKGYIGPFFGVKIDGEDPLFQFKFVVGVYLVLGILQRRSSTNALVTTNVYKYNAYDQKLNEVRSFSETYEDIEYLNRLEFVNSTFKLTDIDTLLKRTDTEFDKANKVISNYFCKIPAKTINQKRLKKNQTMIKNGLYWLYEALKQSQEHLRTVFITSAFDSVLDLKGQEDTKEIKGKLIASIISRDINESEIIYKGVKDLYDIRNSIIHGERSISAIEDYSTDTDNKISETNSLVLYYLLRFLMNRMLYVNLSLEKLKVTPTHKS